MKEANFEPPPLLRLLNQLGYRLNITLYVYAKIQCAKFGSKFLIDSVVLDL